MKVSNKRRLKEGKYRDATSLRAPMRGKTLMSFFIRSIKSFGVGVLKKTNALQQKEQTRKKK